MKTALRFRKAVCGAPSGTRTQDPLIKSQLLSLVARTHGALKWTQVYNLMCLFFRRDGLYLIRALFVNLFSFGALLDIWRGLHSALLGHPLLRQKTTSNCPLRS